LKELDIENFEVKKEPNKKISKTLLNLCHFAEAIEQRIFATQKSS